MILDTILRPASVLCHVAARSKKHCLEILSELLTRPNPDIANEEAFAKLIERERLGCTSLDKGIAFPHCRVNGVKKGSAALIKLLEPVDFDSIEAFFDFVGLDLNPRSSHGENLRLAKLDQDFDLTLRKSLERSLDRRASDAGCVYIDRMMFE